MLIVFLMTVHLSFSDNTVKVALMINAGKEIYIKADDNMEIIVDNETMDKKREVKVSYSKSGIEYNGNIYNNIYLKQKAGEYIYVSKNGTNYNAYRGNISLLPENSRIIPVNIVELDEYIYSVVPCEIGKKFPEQAVKAQIVAARTYAYYNTKNSKFKSYDLVDNTDSQVCKGINTEDENISKLVDSTKNMIITYKGEPINAVFHSDSGGYTANSEDVWGGKPVDYLRSVDDTGNNEFSPRKTWSYMITKEKFKNIFGVFPKEISMEKKNNRIEKIYISDENKKIEITSNEFRKKLGYTNLFSTIFEFQDLGDSLMFNGNGAGHGVGLSQWGAYGLAVKKMKYDQILKYYYTGIKIEELKNVRF